MNEIKINKQAKSITIINNGIAFSQFGIAKEILDLVDNQQQEIERLNNIINELDDEIYSLYEDICNSDDTYSYRIPIEIIIDRLVKMTSKIAKFKENEELKDSD